MELASDLKREQSLSKDARKTFASGTIERFSQLTQRPRKQPMVRDAEQFDDNIKQRVRPGLWCKQTVEVTGGIEERVPTRRENKTNPLFRLGAAPFC